jgi:hypothetical protein
MEAAWDEREKAMPLEVIGAGLSRTGTLSLKLALEQLGFGPCFHMVEFVKPEYEPRRRLWEAVRDGEAPDWEAIFAGYSSAVDMPACLYYRKLAFGYPQAKVILTVRDPISWYRSSIATVWAAQPPGQPSARRGTDRAAKLKAATIREVGFNVLEDPTDEPLTTALFDRYSEQVKRDVPPERLLVFDVREGWAPLCAFLGVPVPQTPFPRENATAEFETRFGSRPRSA